MRSGLTSLEFRVQWIRAFSGAGDEEVFETKASPPAVAGPSTRRPSVPTANPAWHELSL
jgi:hypothetical protein